MVDPNTAAMLPMVSLCSCFDHVTLLLQISMITLLQHLEVQLILLSPQDIAAIEEAKQHVQKDKGFPYNAYLKIVQMRHQRHGADHS